MPDLRVSGGELRGRRLRGGRRGVRPTTERVREALFSMLGDLAGLNVLDLFCGSGALAIEALSRGAARATLVDRDVSTARRNLEQLALSERARVARSDVVRFLRRPGLERYELVLCDPPYRLADRVGAALVPLIPAALAPNGRVVVESARGDGLRLQLPLLTERTYGDTMLRIYGLR
jgi:16S rRNA (guanine966-N2)-methyltransferase